VKVVEGSRIYNFPIHHKLHFYSKIWRKCILNSGSMNKRQAGRDAPALQRVGAPRHAPARAAVRRRPPLGFRALGRTPRLLLPQAHAPRRLEVRAPCSPFGPTRTRRSRTNRRSVDCFLRRALLPRHGRRTATINQLLTPRRRCPSRSCYLRRRPALPAANRADRRRQRRPPQRAPSTILKNTSGELITIL
jgi:hypothetical protein